MTILWWSLPALVVSGCVVLACEWFARRHDQQHGPHYVQQIQILKADKPILLPAIRPLRAESDRAASRTLPFHAGRHL